MFKAPCFVILILIFFSACARLPVQNREEAMRKIDSTRVAELLANGFGSGTLDTGGAPPLSTTPATSATSSASEATQLEANVGLRSLFRAVSTEIQFLAAHPSSTPMVFGSERYSRTEYLAGLRRFLELGLNATTPEAFYGLVAEEFDFYEVYGGNSWGQVFITSYFAPIIEGSRQKTTRFSVPLYQAPEDLVTINLGLFDAKYGVGKTLKGRLTNHTVVPYYSRDEIDGQKVITGKNLEICWVDPVDAFFLQIQGSGTVNLDDGQSLFINYSDQNGHPYAPIGKFMLDKIPLENINLYSLETYLRTLPAEEMQNYFNKNPSYIFFKTSDQKAITYLGVPATAGRTIATDRRYFPKGGLAFLQFDQPVFNTPTDPLPSSFTTTRRFVLDQDVGGAISGGGRVDLFWGEGAGSKKAAGVMKSLGHLYYLAPKRTR